MLSVGSDPDLILSGILEHQHCYFQSKLIKTQQRSHEMVLFVPLVQPEQVCQKLAFSTKALCSAATFPSADA